MPVFARSRSVFLKARGTLAEKGGGPEALLVTKAPPARVARTPTELRPPPAESARPGVTDPPQCFVFT